MTARGATAARRPTEREILEAVARTLQERGFRTYLDPDGTDYFDLAVRRDDEVGLVEGKLGDGRVVLAQALRRRPWADWVAVVLGSERAAERLLERTSGHRTAVVGVWCAGPAGPRELRPARPFHAGYSRDPFVATRARFRQHLVDLDRGVLTTGVRWSNIASAVRRASAGRGFAEWRLDELDDRSG